MTSWPKDVNGYPIVRGMLSIEIQDGAVVPDGDLTIAVAPTNYDISNTIGRYLGAINQAVTDDSTNYVYLDSTGSLVINTSGYPSGVSHIRLARVVTSSGVITRYYDDRSLLTGASTGGGGGEANTMSNVGGGVGVYKQKSGVNFDLRTFAATSPLTVALNGTDVIQLALGVINDTIHGARGGGTLHATATSGTAGFLSASDKAKLDLFAAASEYIRRNGSVAFTGNQSFGNFDARNIRSATYNSEIAVGPASGATSIVWTSGQKQALTLQGDTTLSFTNPAGPCNLILRVIQDVNGGWNITWPASVRWSKGLAPSLTVLGNSIDLVTFYYNNGVYYGGFLDDFK